MIAIARQKPGDDRAFAERISQVPLHFGDRMQARQHTDFMRLKDRVANCSPYLRGLMAKEPDFATDLQWQRPQEVFSTVLESVTEGSPEDVSRSLRLAKRKVALLIAMSDLGGVWDLGEVTGYLTEFADFATSMMTRSLFRQACEHGALPHAEPDCEDLGGLCVLAMGKMGACELNYSSDIDLVFLFDEQKARGEDLFRVRDGFIGIVKRFAALLSEPTSDGYVFRVDLRLRPDPLTTPVCMSMGAAESYYESFGRTWERAVLIKARPCAGDLDAGCKFLDAVSPFVWRRNLDFAAVRDARDMRSRVLAQQSSRFMRSLEGYDIKLGAGGIREIELLAQTIQIIAGGRDRSLRIPATLEALGAIEECGWMDHSSRILLADNYRFWRQTEHCLQMVRDARTHQLPRSKTEFVRLAAMLRCNSTSMLKQKIQIGLAQVAKETESFFGPRDIDDADPDSASFGHSRHEIFERWKLYPVMRNTRSMEIFERIRPAILARLARASDPENALAQFDSFLRRLPAGVQLFSLFEANSRLLDLLCEICAVTPDLAGHLARDPGIFDAVLDRSFFAPVPDTRSLCAGLERILAEDSAFEANLDALRIWQKELHFRIGVQHLQGQINAAQAAAAYRRAAKACLRKLWRPVARHLSRRLGTPRGAIACLVETGSLGSGRPARNAPLDLLLIYQASSRSSEPGRYHVRLMQAIIAALSTATAHGRLYEIDMRKRPSGRSGPAVMTFDSFASAQKSDFSLWERLALVRALPVAGSARLGGQVLELRKHLVASKPTPSRILAEATGLRSFSLTISDDPWEIEAGRGGLLDIELAAQTLALLSGSIARTVPGQLSAGAAGGWISRPQARSLANGYRTLQDH